jgi:hypothetical protein
LRFRHREKAGGSATFAYAVGTRGGRAGDGEVAEWHGRNLYRLREALMKGREVCTGTCPIGPEWLHALRHAVDPAPGLNKNPPSEGRRPATTGSGPPKLVAVTAVTSCRVLSPRPTIGQK